MGWAEILPGFQSLFHRHGMESARAFLDWTGILVNHHRHRQVERVTLLAAERPARDMAESLAGASDYFLKKQFAVTWGERFHNAWVGFGWCATAVREGAMLQALARAGVPSPEVAALGEDGKRAFLLTRAERELGDLRCLLHDLRDEPARRRLAMALGRELARMHDAGFDHPDLFVQHILAGPHAESFRFCILDWQRSRHRRRVSWRIRCRDLALLDATLLGALAGDRLRLRFLRAYRQAAGGQAKPPLARLARAIRARAEALRQERRIREFAQMPTPAGDQAFVPVRGGALFIVQSFAERLDRRLSDSWRSMIDDAAQPWDVLATFASALGLEVEPMRTAASSDAIPALGHTLFRLQRFGIPAPRLLVAGRDGRMLVKTARAMPIADALARAPNGIRHRLLSAAGAIVRRIHEAGYHLPASDGWDRRLGVTAAGEVVLKSVAELKQGDGSWRQWAPLEFSRPRIRLGRGEQLRFLRGYLGERAQREGPRRGERAAA